MSAVPFYDRLLTPPKKSNCVSRSFASTPSACLLGAKYVTVRRANLFFALHYVNHFTMSGLALENRKPNDGTTQRLQGYFRHR